MGKKGFVLWVLGFFNLLLLAACAFLFYALLDRSVTLDYSNQAQHYQSMDISVLRRLLLETGKRMSRAEMEQLLVEQFGKDNIKDEGPEELGIIGSSSVSLVFQGDALVEVRVDE